MVTPKYTCSIEWVCESYIVHHFNGSSWMVFNISPKARIEDYLHILINILWRARLTLPYLKVDRHVIIGMVSVQLFVACYERVNKSRFQKLNPLQST